MPIMPVERKNGDVGVGDETTTPIEYDSASCCFREGACDVEDVGEVQRIEEPSVSVGSVSSCRYEKLNYRCDPRIALQTESFRPFRLSADTN